MKVSISIMLLMVNLGIYSYVIRLVPICESDKIKGPPLATYFNNNITKEVTSVNGSKGYALNRKDCVPISMNNNQAMGIVDVNCKENCENTTILNSNDIVLSNIKQNAVSTESSNVKQNANIVTVQPKTYIKQPQVILNQQSKSNVSYVPQLSRNIASSPKAKLVNVSASHPQVVTRVASQIQPKIITITQSKPQVITRLVSQPHQKIIPVTQSKPQATVKFVPQPQPKIITVTKTLSQDFSRLQPKIITLAQPKPQAVTQIVPPPKPKMIAIKQPHPQIISRIVSPSNPKILTMKKSLPQVTVQPQLRFITVTQSKPQITVEPQPKMITIKRSNPQSIVQQQPRFITITSSQSQVTIQPKPKMITISSSQLKMVTITQPQPQKSNMLTITQPQTQVTTQYIQPPQPRITSVAQNQVPVKFYRNTQQQGQAHSPNNVSTFNQMQVFQPMPQQQTTPQQIPLSTPMFLYPQNEKEQSSAEYYNMKNIGEQHFISLEYLCNMNISPEIPQCINYRIPTPIINIQALPRIVMPKKVLPKIIKNKGIHDFELLKLMNGISLMELRKINKNIKRIYAYIKNTHAVENTNKVSTSPYIINSNQDGIACSFNPQISGSEGKDTNVCYKMLCIGDDCNNNNEVTDSKSSDAQIYTECTNDSSNAPCVVAERNEKEASTENVSHQESDNKTEGKELIVSQDNNDKQNTTSDEQNFQQQYIPSEKIQSNLGITDGSFTDAVETNNQQDNSIITDSNNEDAKSRQSGQENNNALEKANVEDSQKISNNTNGLRSDINIANLRDNDEITIKSEIKIGQKSHRNIHEIQGSDVREEETAKENSSNSESSSKGFYVKGFSRGRKVDLSDDKNKIESSSIHYMKNDEGNKQDESKIVYQVGSNIEDNSEATLNSNLTGHQKSFVDTTNVDNNYTDIRRQELFDEWENRNNYRKLKKEEFNLRIYRLLAKLKDGEYCSNKKDKEICLKLYSHLIKNSYEDKEFHEIVPIHQDVDTERYKDIFEDDIDELILKSILSHKIYKEMMFKKLREESSDSSSNNSIDDNIHVNYTGINKACDYSNGYLNTPDCIKVMKMSDLIKGGGYEEGCSRSLYHKLTGSFDNTYCSLIGPSYDINGENKYFYLSDLLQ